MFHETFIDGEYVIMEDPYGMRVVRQERYDWMFPSGSERRGPQEYPYSYEPYYLWRDFDKENPPPHDTIYTDRMREWDYKKWNRVMDRKKKKWYGQLGDLGGWGLRWNKRQSNIITRRYFGGGYRCIGYGIGANVSNGYEYGVLAIQSPEHQELQNEQS